MRDAFDRREISAMNGPLHPEFRTTSGRELTDEKMEQIRALLIGDVVQHLEARLAMLDDRVRDLEFGVLRRLETLETRMEALAGGAEGDRKATFEALAQSVNELGEQIRRISRG
jgi:hypothetical protein